MRITIGVFAGIFNENGKILLRRREEKNSIISSKSYKGDWELPGGTMEEDNIWKATSERIVGQELAREVEEETGISIEVISMPVMYPTVYISKKKRRVDFAFMIPVGIARERPTKGETTYVSPKELRELADRSKGGQLVSGWGRRMCRMALMALCNSPNHQYRDEAQKMLLEIQKDKRE